MTHFLKNAKAANMVQIFAVVITCVSACDECVQRDENPLAKIYLILFLICACVHMCLCANAHIHFFLAPLEMFFFHK